MEFCAIFDEGVIVFYLTTAEKFDGVVTDSTWTTSRSFSDAGHQCRLDWVRMKSEKWQQHWEFVTTGF